MARLFRSPNHVSQFFCIWATLLPRRSQTCLSNSSQLQWSCCLKPQPSCKPNLFKPCGLHSLGIIMLLKLNLGEFGISTPSFIMWHRSLVLDLLSSDTCLTLIGHVSKEHSASLFMSKDIEIWDEKQGTFRQICNAVCHVEAHSLRFLRGFLQKVEAYKKNMRCSTYRNGRWRMLASYWQHQFQARVPSSNTTLLIKVDQDSGCSPKPSKSKKPKRRLRK